MDRELTEMLLRLAESRATDVMLDVDELVLVTCDQAAQVTLTGDDAGWVASVCLWDPLWEDGVDADQDEWDELEFRSPTAPFAGGALEWLVAAVENWLVAARMTDIVFLRAELDRDSSH